MWKMPSIANYLHRLVAREADQIPLFEGVDGLLERLAARGRRPRDGVVQHRGQRPAHPRRGEQRPLRPFRLRRRVFGKAAKFRRVLKKLKADPARTLPSATRSATSRRRTKPASPPVRSAWGYAARSNPQGRAPDHFFETMDDIFAAVCPNGADPAVNP